LLRFRLRIASTRQAGAASRIHSNAKNKAVCPPAVPGEKACQHIKQARGGNSFFVWRKERILTPATNWRLEAAFTGALEACRHSGGRHPACQ
jgi:hypothetical protein